MSSIFADGWWNQLSTEEHIFWGSAIISTILFVLQTALTFIGIEGHHDDSEPKLTGHQANPKNKFKLFSLKNIIVFFTFFSWGGILILNAGLSTTMAVLIGIGFGTTAMFFAAWVLFKVDHGKEVTNDDLNLTIGQAGEVYIPIPRERTGKGRIQIMLLQGIKELDAVTDDTRIASGEKIVVIEILPDKTLIVERKKGF